MHKRSNWQLTKLSILILRIVPLILVLVLVSNSLGIRTQKPIYFIFWVRVTWNCPTIWVVTCHDHHYNHDHHYDRGHHYDRDHHYDHADGPPACQEGSLQAGRRHDRSRSGWPGTSPGSGATSRDTSWQREGEKDYHRDKGKEKLSSLFEGKI